MSWAEQCQQNKTNSVALKIKINHRNTSNSKPHIKDRIIPEYIRYEKQLSSDDDMIIFGNNNDKKVEHIHVISDKDFVFNILENTEKKLLFQLMIPYLDMDDCVNFMKCCRKYGNIFRKKMDKNNSLLWLWKYLYLRDFGKIKFRKKRRSKLSRKEQIKKHKEKQTDYMYWKQQYELKAKKQFIIKCTCERSRYQLTFYHAEKNCTIRYIEENDMIIISANKCKMKELLDINNIIVSNWYDIEDKKIDLYKNRNSSQPFLRYTYHTKRIRNNGEYGFRDLNVDLMMNNIDISPKGTKGYVYPVQYVKLKCYLIEIMGFNDKEMSKCTLLESGNGELIEGVIVNRILNVKKLQFKMLEFAKKRSQLMVLVYGMTFGVSAYNYNTIDKYNLGADGKYVVVDYYDNI